MIRVIGDLLSMSKCWAERAAGQWVAQGLSVYMMYLERLLSKMQACAQQLLYIAMK